jgi:glycosyltransferase involved in cell wall biosynthesis
MLTTFYPPYNFGGDGVFVHRLANELARRGHLVDVVHCRDTYRLLASREPTASYNDHPNVTVHGLESPFGWLSLLVSHQTGSPLFKATRIRQILATGFDVIHYFNISLFGPKILTYGQGIKLYTMLEYWLICPTHVLFRFNRTPCTRPSCFTCSLIYKRPPQWWRYTGVLEEAAAHVDAFIAPSRFSRDKHQQMGFKTPIVHLPYFIPAVKTPAALSPRAEPPEMPYFLFVGRLEKLKGLQTLIPVFRHYPRAQLWIVGTGPYEHHLRRLASGSENIRFLGHVPEQRLHTLYRRAVALLVPSICHDVSPLVILEAFSAQTPALVRNLGGMPELIAESGGGVVYGTEAQLVAAMDRLLVNPSLRETLGRRGYQAYQRKWTAEVYLERYFALIHQIGASRSGTGQAVGV